LSGFYGFNENRLGVKLVSGFDSIKRSLRNYRRKKHRVLPTGLPAPFYYAEDIDSVHRYFSAPSVQNNLKQVSERTLDGHCFICKKNVSFIVAQPADGEAVNWRETLSCPQCGLINRWRSCIHVFETICEPTAKDRIYLTETLSPVYQNLAGRYPSLVSSEYFPDHEFGETVQTHVMPVRNEDVTKLTFTDSCLEIILCFDVLEHVPGYRSALREFYRVLGKGGQLVLSVPFSHDQKTLVRASVDLAGNIEHLVEPCYHGDPLSEQGVLSYYDFGMELLEDMREAGFQESFLSCYTSKYWGYLNGNVVFIARKL
jgi:SAM-dependent methyltransferase